MIKSNKNLFIVMIAIITLLMLFSGLCLFLHSDTSKYVKDAFKNLDKESFTYIDTIVMQDNLVVYKDVKNIVENPLNLKITDEGLDNFNLSFKNAKGDKKINDDTLTIVAKGNDSEKVIGKKVENLEIIYVIDMNTSTFKSILITYEDDSYFVTINAYKEA